MHGVLNKIGAEVESRKSLNFFQINSRPSHQSAVSGYKL